MKQSTRDKIAKSVKVATATSGPVAIAFMFPAETFAFLKMLKDAGFEAGTLGVIAGIAYYFRRDAVRIVDVRLTDVTSAIKEMGDKFETSNQQTHQHILKNHELFTETQAENNAKFNELGEKILLIEGRMQALVPFPDRAKELTEEIRAELQSGLTESKPNKEF